MNRRKFINFFLGGSLIGTVIAFLYPLISYLLPTKQIEVVIKKITAAKLGELAPNTSKIFKFGTSPVLLINNSDGDLMSLSDIFTNLTFTVI